MIAIDILAVVDRSGEEWWFDNFFLLGSGSGGGSLPIILTSFNAIQDGTSVDLSFLVHSQINNDYFTIERSLDCYEWEDVGRIEGCGNCNTPKTYNFEDKQPYVGLSYYRLRQTDYNEITETFAPVSLYFKNKMTIELNIKPNPAIDYIELEMDYTTNRDINHSIQIYDMTGHKVYKKYFIGGVDNFKINIQKFPSGTYLLKTKSSEYIGEGKFIKK